MNIMIIDTETVSGMFNGESYQNTVFDIGYVIVDTETGEIVHQYSALVKEVCSLKGLMSQVYFGIDYLKEHVYSRTHEYKTFEDISQDFWSAIDKYSIKDVYAYNVTFDTNALFDTSMLLKPEKRINLNNGLKTKDLYNMACTAVSKSERYTAFCVDNNFLTDRGNLKSSAESIYAYIKNDPCFIEEHTALQDAIIEKEIFMWCKQYEKETGKELPTEPNSQAWRLVQK